jgi:dnd system-associated protein 4
MVDRVRRPQEFDTLLGELTKGKEAIFETYKHALVFAACLGFQRQKKLPFEKSSEPIHLTVFSGEFDQAIMNAIAISETGDPFVMGNARVDEKIKIFEDYACGGLEILNNLLESGPQSRLETLLELTMTEEKSGDLLDSLTSLA